MLPSTWGCNPAMAEFPESKVQLQEKKDKKTQTKTENPLLSTAYNLMSDRTVLRAFPLDPWS